MNNAVTKLIKLPATRTGNRWFYTEDDYASGDFVCAVDFRVLGKKQVVYASGTLPIAVNEMIENVIINSDIELVYGDHGFSDGYTDKEIATIRRKLCGS